MIQSISILKKYSVFLCKNAARIGVVKMKENENRIGYYSVIPATVLYNKELKANEKLLYAIITSLACKEGYCFENKPCGCGAC